MSDDRAKIVAAAHATASWARARRATWTSAPLIVPETQRQFRAVEPPPVAEVAPQEPVPTLAERTRAMAEALRSPIERWLPRAGIALLLAGTIAAAVRYGPTVWQTIAVLKPHLNITPQPPAPVAPAPAVAQKATGTLRVESTPSGARVLVDGSDRGFTPLTLEDVPIGRHTVILQSPAGTIQRTIAIAPGTVSDIDESIFSGWIVVYAPFEVTVSEANRVLRPDDRNEIMLPAGPHDLRFTNRALEFEEVRRLNLKPGERVTVSLSPPRSSVSVTASEPAEVWLDGTHIGATPLSGVPAALGTHELVLRRGSGGDRRLTITVTARPAVIHVDFSKPQGAFLRTVWRVEQVAAATVVERR